MSPQRLQHRFVSSFAGYPPIYLPLARSYLALRHGAGSSAVSRRTQIVIEGFPRCANTFSVRAFRYAQRNPVRLAHHLHAPAQIIAACRWSVPALVLIREPDAAVVSYVTRETHIDLTQALKDYIRFYRAIMPWRRDFVLAEFKDVISDFGSVIARINARFGTAFELFDHSRENVARCYTPPRRISEQARTALRERLAEPRHGDLLAKARALHAEITSSVSFEAAGFSTPAPALSETPL